MTLSLRQDAMKHKLNQLHRPMLHAKQNQNPEEIWLSSCQRQMGLRHQLKFLTLNNVTRSPRLMEAGRGNVNSLDLRNLSKTRLLCGIYVGSPYRFFSLLLNILPEPSYRSTDMTREDKLCLFLAKLTLGVSFNALATIFGVAESTESSVLKKTLDVLSAALKEWVFVPPRTIIKQCMPQPFKENYPDCTFIIDCVEVRAETPSNPDCQRIVYSNYKEGYTLKVLVGVIPNGMMAFMSGEQQTDSFIAQDFVFF